MSLYIGNREIWCTRPRGVWHCCKCSNVASYWLVWWSGGQVTTYEHGEWDHGSGLLGLGYPGLVGVLSSEEGAFYLVSNPTGFHSGKGLFNVLHLDLVQFLKIFDGLL